MAGSHNLAGMVFAVATARPEAAHAAAIHDLRRLPKPRIASERAAHITETTDAKELRTPEAALNTGRDDG